MVLWHWQKAIRSGTCLYRIRTAIHSFIHVHEIAKKAVWEYYTGRKNEAEKYLQEISEKFFVVIEKLKALKEILLDGKKQYIH